VATFATVARKVDRLAGTVSPQSRRRILTRLGADGKQDYMEEISRDLGADLTMSNWRRAPKKQIKFGARYKVLDDNRVVISPRPVGPFKVVDLGRKAGTSKRGRPVSASRGHRTADRAQNVIIDKTPARARKLVAANIARAMR
jgi:hypothetical protein